ncbi:hypothetical protein CIY_03190 [Butyrivibrio fibrisolvens 16/4]|nr:hypothetical protein CIY_03190 [Butyrivibrio fibrisolvens 16/4]
MENFKKLTKSHCSCQFSV